MNNLQIKQEKKDDKVVLMCSGRLDANWSGYLNDYIDGLVREGKYNIGLDLIDIEYLSSAGIRSLVQQYKNLKSVNGSLHIIAMSENVNQVLSMVGMSEMLSEVPDEIEVAQSSKEQSNQIDTNGFTLSFSSLIPDGRGEAGFYGNPDQVMISGFLNKHARQVKSKDMHFAIGLGAIGESFEECKNRFGEYMMLGNSIVYLPADGSGKPDYMISSGKYIASLTELYGIHFQGDFSYLVQFEPRSPQTTIDLSALVEGINKHTDLKSFAVVMVAESGGLIGASLNASPVDGKKIFSYPEIKDTINFTTEPAHNKMLTLSIGYYSSEESEESGKFLRPLKPGSKLKGHIHSAVFPYVALKKANIDLSETIEFLFSNSELSDVLHLTNDSRDIVGLGESQFVHGFCWVIPIESNNIIPTK